MFNIFKTSKSVSHSIDEFFDKIELGNLNLRTGINNYLKGNISDFEENLKSNYNLEKEADTLKRKIENDFYIHSLMPNYASDIINLLDKVDDIIDKSIELLSQFDVESPDIPEDVKKKYSKLTGASTKTVENMVSAARIFFTSPELVKEKIQKGLFHHREAHNLATDIKRTLFNDCKTLKLSEKIHCRYFALHIEQVADAAKTVAFSLTTLVLKIKM